MLVNRSTSRSIWHQQTTFTSIFRWLPAFHQCETDTKTTEKVYKYTRLYIYIHVLTHGHVRYISLIICEYTIISMRIYSRKTNKTEKKWAAHTHTQSEWRLIYTSAWTQSIASICCLNTILSVDTNARETVRLRWHIYNNHNMNNNKN